MRFIAWYNYAKRTETSIDITLMIAAYGYHNITITGHEYSSSNWSTPKSHSK